MNYLNAPMESESRARLIVHIGAPKTGSSAIQSALYRASLSLSRSGNTKIFIPDVNLTLDGTIEGHQVWAFEQIRQDLPLGRKKLEDLISAAIARHKNPTIVISAENLSNPNGCARIFERLPGVDIQVVLYIRRQDNYLLSAWQQWYCKVYDDIWTWLLESIGIEGDWCRCIQDWERIASSGRVLVRIFDRNKMIDRDVVSDFLMVTELRDQLPPFDRVDVPINPSFSEVVSRLGRHGTTLFKDAHDNGFFDAVHELTGSKYFRKEGESPISVRQRSALLKFYAQSNEWVRAKYFPELPYPLFSAPDSSEVVYSSAETSASAELGLLADLFYGLYKRTKEEK